MQHSTTTGIRSLRPLVACRLAGMCMRLSVRAAGPNTLVSAPVAASAAPKSLRLFPDRFQNGFDTLSKRWQTMR